MTMVPSHNEVLKLIQASQNLEWRLPFMIGNSEVLRQMTMEARKEPLR